MTRTAALTPNTGLMVKAGARAAFPVTASPLNATAQSMNWIMGRGTPLVVDGGHLFAGSSTSLIRVLNYRCYVDANHPTLGVYVVMHAVDAPSLSISLNGEWYTVGAQAAGFTFPIDNTVGTGELSIALTFNFNGTVSRLAVDGVYVYESPVSLIENSGSEGVPVRTPIYDGYADHRSIAGLERCVEDLRTTYFRKGALYNWAYGGASTGPSTRSTTSTTYVPLHADGIKPAIQTRRMYDGPTTGKVKCSVMAGVSGGTGNVRLTMTSGAVVTFNVTSTVAAGVWHTSQDLVIETNDPSVLASNGGIRGGSRDEVTIELRAGAGQECWLYAVSIWDAPGDPTPPVAVSQLPPLPVSTVVYWHGELGASSANAVGQYSGMVLPGLSAPTVAPDPGFFNGRSVYQSSVTGQKGWRGINLFSTTIVVGSRPWIYVVGRFRTDIVSATQWLVGIGRTSVASYGGITLMSGNIIKGSIGIGEVTGPTNDYQVHRFKTWCGEGVANLMVDNVSFTSGTDQALLADVNSISIGGRSYDTDATVVRQPANGSVAFFLICRERPSPAEEAALDAWAQAYWGAP